MTQWERAVGFMVDDVAKQVEAMRELSIPEQKIVVEEVKKEVGRVELPAHVDLYTLLNAVTSSAKLAPPARRIEIEAVAGELLQTRIGDPS